MTPPANSDNARQLVERAYTHWFGKTDNAIAAAILTQCETRLFLSTPAVDADTPAAANGPLSVKQAAAELGVSPETIYKLCAENALRHTRIGRRITIPRQYLEEYRDSHRYRHISG